MRLNVKSGIDPANKHYEIHMRVCIREGKMIDSL